MTLSSSYFEGCGFPEEYIFWVSSLIVIILVFSLIVIMVTVKEEFMKKAPLYFSLIYLFNSKAFTNIGNVFRVTFFILLPIAIGFDYLLIKMYEIGWLSCGSEYLLQNKPGN